MNAKPFLPVRLVPATVFCQRLAMPNSVPKIPQPRPPFQSSRKGLDKTVIPLLPLRLRCRQCTNRERRIGGQPEPHEQGQSFGRDLGLLIERTIIRRMVGVNIEVVTSLVPRGIRRAMDRPSLDRRSSTRRVSISLRPRSVPAMMRTMFHRKPPPRSRSSIS